jgi:hypothetical protein
VAAHDAALDAVGLAVPVVRHPARRPLGLRSARLGRLLGVGPGRERLVHALDRGDRLSALGDGAGEAGHAEDLEPRADRAHVHPVPVRHDADAQWPRAVGARLRADRDLRNPLPRLRALLRRALLRSGAVAAPDAARDEPTRVRALARGGLRREQLASSSGERSTPRSPSG